MYLILFFLVSFFQPDDTTSSQPSAYQGLNYELTELGFHTTFDPSSGRIFLYNQENRHLISIHESGIVDTLATFPEDIERLDYMESTHDGESIYFWESGIGRVHRYDLETGTVEREDTSYSHRTMFGHAAFLSEDEFIYAIGGYGYWEMRNFLIRYEREYGQWEKVPTMNDELVIRQTRGLLYQLDGDFYYFVRDEDAEPVQRSYAYRLDSEKRMWETANGLQDVFEQNNLRWTFGGYSFTQFTTHMVDHQKRQLGFLSKKAGGWHLMLISPDEESVYNVNLSLLGVNDVRAVFYSERVGRWIILGHEFALTQRRQLKGFLFEFDTDHPYVTKHQADQLPLQAMYITGAGTAVLTTFILLLYLFRTRSDRSTESQNGESETAEHPKPISIHKKGQNLTVYIRGNRFKTSEDKALQELWVIVAEMVQAGENTMLVSNIDQRIYPNQSHPSYNSRNRKKLFRVINNACGFELISEERSKIDKRYKVIVINKNKIALTDE